MIIKQVDSIVEAKQCDRLLTKLIESEKEYNNNLKDNYIVSKYFEKIYNKKNGAIFVAIEDTIIGYIYIKIVTNDDGPELEREALLDGFYVEENYRNKKIGTKLIKEAEKWAKNNSIKYILLNVLNENILAQKLYKKLGYNNFLIRMKKEI